MLSYIVPGGFSYLIYKNNYSDTKMVKSLFQFCLKFLFNPLQYLFGRHNEIKKEKKFGICLVLKSRVTLIHHLKVHKSWLTHNYNRMHLELNKTEIGTPVAPNLSCICWSIKACVMNVKSWVPTVQSGELDSGVPIVIRTKTIMSKVGN